MKTLVVDAIAPEGLVYLREHGFEIDQLMKPSLPTLYERVGDYEALVTRSGTAVTPELLETRRGSGSSGGPGSGSTTSTWRRAPAGASSWSTRRSATSCR